MIKLFTHNDLDGVGCAILAKLAFGNNVEIEYVYTPDELNKKLDSIDENHKYEKIFVTDCSCKDIHVLRLYGLRLFDHHKTAFGLNEYDNATVKVDIDGRLTCGTELFYQYLRKHGEINDYSFFVEQVRLYDTWDWKKCVYKLPQHLNNLLYIYGISEFVEKMVLRLAKCDVNELTIFDTEDRLLLDYEQKLCEKYVAKKMESVKLYHTGKRDVAVVFADRYQSMLGQEMCKKHNDCIAVMIDMNKRVLSFRTSGTCDVAELARMSFAGGGHAQAAGASIPDVLCDSVLDEIVDKLVGAGA